MILQENYISFEQFVQYFKKLRAKDKVWLISLLYNTSSRNYFEITKDSQVIGIGSISKVEQEIAFVIFRNFQRLGYGRQFICYMMSEYPSSIFFISKFNKRSLNLFKSL